LLGEQAKRREEVGGPHRDGAGTPYGRASSRSLSFRQPIGTWCPLTLRRAQCVDGRALNSDDAIGQGGCRALRRPGGLRACAGKKCLRRPASTTASEGQHDKQEDDPERFPWPAGLQMADGRWQMGDGRWEMCFHLILSSKGAAFSITGGWPQ